MHDTEDKGTPLKPTPSTFSQCHRWNLIFDLNQLKCLGKPAFEKYILNLGRSLILRKGRKEEEKEKKKIIIIKNRIKKTNTVNKTVWRVHLTHQI